MTRRSAVCGGSTVRTGGGASPFGILPKYLSRTGMISAAFTSPTMAVTIQEEASLVRSPSPWMANAKCVGYMIDMKKKLRISHQSP